MALLAMVGPLYIDIMPSIVAALRSEYGLSAAQAGFVAASNGYGSTLGALLALFIVPRLPWRPLAVALLVALVAADVATTLSRSMETLVVVRASHGVIGGMLVGLCYALIARTGDPRQGFGILFVFHFGFGGLGVFASTLLAPFMTRGVVFLVLAAFGVLALLVIPWLPAFEPPQRETSREDSLPVLPARRLMRIGGLFLFQAANLGLGAFLIGIGADLGHAASFSGAAVGLGLWAGVVGALAMLILSRNLGWRPMVPIVLAAGLSKALVGFGDDPAVFAGAIAAVFLTMAMALPYAFALCAEGDSSGRSAVLAGFASKLGLSTGPAVGGLVYAFGAETLIATAIATVVAAAVLFALSLRPHSARQFA
ncbi:MFS family permease [Ancylobacter sp. 3268]|uniref:MFS transporter n=1 Tax=Ancylobacter sp. 3268 TaxID=2817752 RepID=UPI0028633471|nr:MFS transporter [Ancylobacter sp. 3268]MDR6950683.1 MFS family permease [Ancylobacter sp. 3268]